MGANYSNKFKNSRRSPRGCFLKDSRPCKMIKMIWGLLWPMPGGNRRVWRRSRFKRILRIICLCFMRRNWRCCIRLSVKIWILKCIHSSLLGLEMRWGRFVLIESACWLIWVLERILSLNLKNIFLVIKLQFWI